MVKTGLDNIKEAHALLKDARIGLMTNPTGVNREMASAIDIIHEKYRLTALFACEHGVRGSATAGESIDSFIDEKTGVTVYSCYGKNTHLTDEMLSAFDVFVYDIQDAGARFYTFIYSLSDAMQDCARAGKSVLVLDRPNPLGGLSVQGTMLNEDVSSFVGRFEMPTRYALTVGEYALWVKDKLNLSLDLHVVPMSGWKREMEYEETKLLFVPPSPNLSTMHAARAYTGTCIFEGTNISEGRGTALPFELIGAPFIDGEKLARHMNAMGLEGYYFRPAHFVPCCSKFAGEHCEGVQIYTEDFDIADPPLMGLTLMDEIRNMAGGSFKWTDTIDRLVGTKDYREGKVDGKQLILRDNPKIIKWRRDSKRFMLY